MVTVVQGKVCAKNHPDRLSRLATIHQRYRRTDFLWHRPRPNGRPKMKGELSVRINVRREYVLEEYVPGIHVQIPSAHMERSAFISRHQDSCLPCHWCSLYLHAAETKRGRYLCGIKSFNTMSCSNAVFQHWHNPTIVLPLVHCPAVCSKSAQKSAVLLINAFQRICSGVSSRYCCYENHTAGSKPILKLFILVNGELNKVSLCQK